MEKSKSCSIIMTVAFVMAASVADAGGSVISEWNGFSVVVETENFSDQPTVERVPEDVFTLAIKACNSNGRQAYVQSVKMGDGGTAKYFFACM